MTSSDEARALVDALRAKADPYKDNTLLDAADLIERLTAPPTDDEREALEAHISAIESLGHRSDAPWPSLNAVIEAARDGLRRQVPITDAQVKRAHAAWDAFPDYDPNGEAYAWEHEDARIRAALEAARELEKNEE